MRTHPRRYPGGDTAPRQGQEPSGEAVRSSKGESDAKIRKRRKKKTGLGRYRDYTNEYLYEELGLDRIAGQGSVRYSSR